MQNQKLGTKNNRKRGWRFFSSMGIFIPFLLSVFFILSTLFTFVINTQEKTENLENAASKSVSAKLALVSGTVEYGIRNQQMSLVRTIMSNLRIDPDVVLLALVNKEGVITASDNGQYLGKSLYETGLLPPFLHGDLSESINKTRQQFQEIHQFYSIKSNKDTLIGYSPIYDFDINGKANETSALVLVYDLTSNKDHIRAEGYRTLSAQLIVNFIITLLIALIFHIKITRRAQVVLGKINAFIAGEDNVKFGETRTDEIGLIAKGLQKLFLSIQSKTESLALKTRELSRLNRALTLENKERKAAENSAAELLEFNQTIIADSSYGILVYDDSLNCLLVNPFIERTFAIDANSLVGTSINSPPFDQLFATQFLESLQSGTPIREYIFSYQNYWFELSASKITYKAKNTFLLTINDITQQKRVQDQQTKALSAAEAANRSKSNFLANMSHEIRTPMNSILGIAELLKETPLNTEQEELLKRLEASGSSLLLLINDILDLSKIEAGQLNFDSIDFDLQNLVEETLGILSIPATKKGLELSLNFDPQIPTSYKGDPLRIKQILINLIGNSIKFTKAGSVKLEIKPNFISSKKGNLTFSVKDTGIGMSDSTLKNLFKPFYQADATTTRVYGGTGLGLTICRELVTRMDGSIWVESELNGGSTFFFTLNLVRSAAKPNPVVPNTITPSIHPTASIGSELTFPRVLIIDDSEENRFLVKRFLKNQPLQLSEAENGEVGLRMIQSEDFSLALIDIQMPVLDGNSTIKLIREWEQQQQRPFKLKIIVLTANAMKEDFEYSLSLGADSYITKPINKMNLISEINKYLDPQKQQKQSA